LLPLGGLLVLLFPQATLLLLAGVVVALELIQAVAEAQAGIGRVQHL
jgi:hypothetical protein